MTSLLRQMLRVAGLVLIPAAIFTVNLPAQDWQTSESLPGVDLKSLTPAQRASTLKILREQGCPCGCSMKIAQCRQEDPACSYSNGLSVIVTDCIKQGKTEGEAIKEAAASRWAHDQNTGRILDDAISIPVAGSPVSGPGKAPVTIVEFSDFQCPYCVAAIPEIDGLLKVFPQQVKLIFKQYPLDSHSQAHMAAAAALAAHQQGKFWVMHDSLFAHHNDLSRPQILALAKERGLDMKRFEVDMDSRVTSETIAKDIRDGDSANVEGTPTLFINGQRYNGRIDLSLLKPLITAELKKTAAPAQTASR